MFDKTKIRRLLRKLPKNNQKGFTLIELLVVISILGILAAVVTMSMVGITRVAQDRAAKTELQTVQVAMDTMLADQGVTGGHECDGTSGTATTNMASFPAAATVAHEPVPLYPNYLRQHDTHGTYLCTANGQIQQVAYNP